MRRHADLVRLRHHPALVGALAAAALAAGCGGANADAKPCAALERLPGSVTTASAHRSLQALVAAEEAALPDAEGDLAAELGRAISRARLALGAFEVDPRESGTMSPTTTIAATTRRLVAEATSIRRRYC